MRVRRSNDSALLDIGFTASGDLDETALTTFVGANSATVLYWYDQSGNGRHLVQTTNASQPRIVNAGTIDKKNNEPCLTFTGTQSMTFASPQQMVGTGGVFTHFTVAHVSSITTTQVISGQDSGSGTRLGQWCYVTASTVGGYTWSTAPTQYTALASGIVNGTLLVVSTVRGTTAIQTWTNNNGTSGSIAVAGTGQTGSSATFTLGQSAAGGSAMTGGVAELIVYPADLATADRNVIERNQGTYYGVTVS